MANNTNVKAEVKKEEIYVVYMGMRMTMSEYKEYIAGL
jgi:hypothetical protein